MRLGRCAVMRCVQTREKLHVFVADDSAGCSNVATVSGCCSGSLVCCGGGGGGGDSDGGGEESSSSRCLDDITAAFSAAALAAAARDCRCVKRWLCMSG